MYDLELEGGNWGNRSKDPGNGSVGLSLCHDWLTCNCWVSVVGNLPHSVEQSRGTLNPW